MDLIKKNYEKHRLAGWKIKNVERKEWKEIKRTMELLLEKFNFENEIECHEVQTPYKRIRRIKIESFPESSEELSSTSLAQFYGFSLKRSIPFLEEIFIGKKVFLYEAEIDSRKIPLVESRAKKRKLRCNKTKNHILLAKKRKFSYGNVEKFVKTVREILS